MINPSPVNSKNSPYSNNPQFTRVTPPEPKNKKARPWRRALGMIFTCLTIASISYGVAQYYSLKNSIIVAHEGDSSTAVLSLSSSSNGSKLDLAQFKKVGDGRFNLLVVGVGGENHPGSYLTDSLQILSLDTINRKYALSSIPRDLYVNIPGHGKGKINSVYHLGEQSKKGSGSALLRQVAGSVVGVKISNFVLIDFAGAEEAIDAIGGIEVDVPKAINDPFFPDDRTVGYSPFSIAAGPQHLNGHTALRYARSRETTSDFDRSARQQLILAAMKKKALSMGVLSNPAKITSLLNVLGRHVRTDLQAEEIKAFFSIFKESAQEGSFVLDTSSQLGLLASSSDPVAGYISYPSEGINDFSKVQSWFAKNNPDPLLKQEKATVTVYNGGSATSKQLQNLIASLTDYGFTVTLSGEVLSSRKKSSRTAVYAKSNKMPITRNYLSSYFNNAPVQDGTVSASGSDFEIVYVPSLEK